MKWLRKLIQGLRDTCEDDGPLRQRLHNALFDWRRFELPRKFVRFTNLLKRGSRGRWRRHKVLSQVVQLQPELDATHGMSEFRVLSPRQHIEVDETRYAALLSRTTYFEFAPIPFRTAFVCQLEDAKIHLGEGVLLTRENAVVLDSAFAQYRLVTSTAYGSLLPASVPRLKGRYASVWGLFASNTFHWLVDCLPRLHSLELVTQNELAGGQPLALLMPASATAYHRESLACCLPAGMEVRYLENLGWTEVSEFVFPSYVTQAQFAALPADSSAALRQRIWQRLDLAPPRHGTKRIYISRRQATHRRVLNETTVMRCLEKRGFRSYTLENLSFRQQVELFSEAEIVVGAHGAGLTNILFSPHVKVVELHTSNVLAHYCFLSQSLAHEYASVISAPRPNSRHLVVSIPELEATLDALL